MIFTVLPVHEWTPLLDCDPATLWGELLPSLHPRLCERLQRIGFDTTGRIWCHYDRKTQSLTFRQDGSPHPIVEGPHVNSGSATTRANS